METKPIDEETHKTVAVRIPVADYTLLCMYVDELRKEHGPTYRMSDMLRTVISCWLHPANEAQND